MCAFLQSAFIACVEKQRMALEYSVKFATIGIPCCVLPLVIAMRTIGLVIRLFLVRRDAGPHSGQKDPPWNDGGRSPCCIGKTYGNQMSVLEDGARDHKIIELLCLGRANSENSGDNSSAVAVHSVGPALRSRHDLALARGGSGKGLIHDECSGKVALSVHISLGKCDGNVGAIRTDDCVVPLQTGKVKAGRCVLRAS